MKAVFLAASLLLATSAQASFQVGQVTEVAIGHESASFQLDTSNGGLDLRESCLDVSKPLNFVIDLSAAGGVVLLEQVLKAKSEQGTLAVNGDGQCIGDEFEKLDRLVPQS